MHCASRFADSLSGQKVELQLTRIRTFQILYLTYMDPCELLISSWMSLTIRYFCYVYTTGFPVWHVAITMERAWATFRPQNYERRSSAYGIACSVLVVSQPYLSQ